MQPAFAESLGQGRARAALLWPEADWKALGLEGAILAPRPRYVLAGVSRVFDRPPEIAPGVHPLRRDRPDRRDRRGRGRSRPSS